MMRLFLLRLFLLFALTFVLIGAFSAIAAGLETPESNADFISYPLTANSFKPIGCTQNLTHIVRGAGVIQGTLNNELIIGSWGNDVITGGGGDDCILGGGGNDTLDGEEGSDVCYGGYGDDVFINCEIENP